MLYDDPEFDKAVQPVGTIVQSVLDEDEFNLVAAGEWAPADGRVVDADTAYARVVHRGQQRSGGSLYDSAIIAEDGNVRVPDLRGLFLRGKQNARADGSGNPDGDMPIGRYQADEVGAHAHSFASGYHGSESHSGGQGLYGAATGQTDYAGGAETRSRNVTINYFIRIN